MPAGTNRAAPLVPLLMYVSCSGACTSGSDARDRAPSAPLGSTTESRSPAPAPSASEPADPEPTPRDGALLAYEDARFFTWSDRQRPRWSGEPIDRTKPLQRILALRVVASRGDYHEVILGAPLAGTCFGERPATWSISLRLWMHRRDIIPSITSPLVRTFADGTSIQVAPGTAVTTNDGGKLSLRSRLLTVEVEARDAIIGEIFTPPDKRLQSKGAGRFLDGHGTSLELGAPSDRSRAVVANPTGERSGYDIEITELIEVKRRVARVKVEDQCIAVVARVPEDHLARNGRGWGSGGMCGHGSNGYTHMIEPGTELFFPDGAPAGVVTERRHVEIRNADWGERACFVMGVDAWCASSTEGGIELCVQRDELKASRRGK